MQYSILNHSLLCRGNGGSCTSLSQTSNTSPEDSNMATQNTIEQGVEIALEEELDVCRMDNWPSCWTLDQRLFFTKKYTWLCASRPSGLIGCKMCARVAGLGPSERTMGMKITLQKEWVDCAISGSGADKIKQQKSLRKKIYEHMESKSHKHAETITEIASTDLLKTIVVQQQKSEHLETNNVFNIAYHIAKNNRPYVDHPSLIDLQRKAGVNVGRVLHSNVICADIIDHIATEMRKKLLLDIIRKKPPVAVLVDESTSNSNKTCLIVYIRCSLDNSLSPVTFFLDLIELGETTAAGICKALLDCLAQHGLTESMLEETFLALGSDGASVMLGSSGGVYARLKEKFVDLISWHCFNHRIELSVHDAVVSCTQINHFKIFMDKLYSLFSMSPKNRRQIELCASQIGAEFMKIGRVLDVRWSASSFRAVRAVWRSYRALHAFFKDAAHDSS